MPPELDPAGRRWWLCWAVAWWPLRPSGGLAASRTSPGIPAVWRRSGSVHQERSGRQSRQPIRARARPQRVAEKPGLFFRDAAPSSDAVHPAVQQARRPRRLSPSSASRLVAPGGAVTRSGDFWNLVPSVGKQAKAVPGQARRRLEVGRVTGEAGQARVSSAGTGAIMPWSSDISGKRKSPPPPTTTSPRPCTSAPTGELPDRFSRPVDQPPTGMPGRRPILWLPTVGGPAPGRRPPTRVRGPPIPRYARSPTARSTVRRPDGLGLPSGRAGRTTARRLTGARPPGWPAS